jgi:hypothetical protein
MIAGGMALFRSRQVERPLALLAMTIPFVLWGCLAPSRFHVQYFSALMPFLALGSIELCRATVSSPLPARTLAAMLIALALACGVRGARHYASVGQLANFNSWGPVSAHRLAAQLRSDLGPGRILTLDPMLVAEGGSAVYPEVSSGEFGWRTAHLLPRDKRRRLKMVCAYDIEPWLRTAPPDGIILDWTDPQLTPPLIDWARAHQFKPFTRYGSLELWSPLSPH